MEEETREVIISKLYELVNAATEEACAEILYTLEELGY